MHAVPFGFLWGVQASFQGAKEEKLRCEKVVSMFSYRLKEIHKPG